MEERKEKVRQFFARFLRNRGLNDDEDIFSLGFVNSLAAMQLVNFLEKEFDITIEDDDLDFDNFRTVNSIDGLLERKLAARAGR